MLKNPRTIFHVAITAIISTSALASSASAALFYSATGYPNPAVTNGKYSFDSETDATSYESDAQPITLSSPAFIDTWNIIAQTDDGTWASKELHLNVWSAAGGLTKEQAFDANPNVGNVIALVGVSVASSQLFGDTPPISTEKNYYTILSFQPFNLPAGDYLFSVQEQGSGGTWGIAESSINLGAGIYTNSDTPGTHVSNTSNIGITTHTTGTVAMDIGSSVPEPGGIAILGLGGLWALRRKRH